MNKIYLLSLLLASFTAKSQTTITNGGFELWGNTVPSGDTYTEPTNWYSNQSGSSIAALGGETCFKDATVVHSGSYSVRVETISGPLSTVINGNVTTGVVDAPSLSKTDGYIGTVNYSTATDIRHMSYTGRPDSLVGWYQYTQGGSAETGKVRAILHTGDYYDPETPTTYHANPTANKIADALFLTPASNATSWTRFSVPFTYVSTSSPAYIMVNVTSSSNQGTTVVGSKLWLDDLQVVYKPSGVEKTILAEDNVSVYSSGKSAFIDFENGNESKSELTLFDIAGRKVFSTSLTSEGLSAINLCELNSGIYLYQLSNQDFRKTGKLFIQ